MGKIEHLILLMLVGLPTILKICLIVIFYNFHTHPEEVAHNWAHKNEPKKIKRKIEKPI